MQVQQQNADNIANNLANASTVGFKRARLEFQDILYQNLRTPGAASNASTALPVGLQIGLGARAVSSERIFLQGDFHQTENPLDMVIGTDGTVSVTVPGQANAQNVGQIQLASFANPAGLESIGRNLYKETAASGQPTVAAPDSQGLGRINQGFVEGSNVNVVEELVTMIAAQRIYETNSKVITAADRMLGTINQAVS
jgi:flagellar basal-body rod protein FlgG